MFPKHLMEKSQHFGQPNINLRGFPGGTAVKNIPAMQEMWIQSLSQEDPQEHGMATHSSILAWKIPWTEEPGGLYSPCLPEFAQIHVHSVDDAIQPFHPLLSKLMSRPQLTRTLTDPDSPTLSYHLCCSQWLIC